MTPGEHKKRYIGGAVLLLAVAAVILAVFSLLSRTDKMDLYLADNADERFGWRYEALVSGQVLGFEPQFSDGWLLTVPEGGGGGAHHAHHDGGDTPGRAGVDVLYGRRGGIPGR